MHPNLVEFQSQLKNELKAILQFWMENTPDELYGGFAGRLDVENNVDLTAPKGAVLNARILWSFAAAYNFENDIRYLNNATRAYNYIIDHFVDEKFGGIYWTLDYEGMPLDTKKQVYAIAFTIYALSEYFIASGNDNAKQIAIKLYKDLVKYSYDEVNQGYFEAYTRDWKLLSDLRLSDKDANEKKTMNTHLHVLEAYTTLYKIWPQPELKIQIEQLIMVFIDHIVDSKTSHLILFFDELWNRKSHLVSYGHDIEASWLLLEAARIIGNNSLIVQLSRLATEIAEVTKSGLDIDGGLFYEYDPATNHKIVQKHWWVQAEAMVGYYNAYQISGEMHYLDLAMNNWQFVFKSIIDHNNGEWFWGRDSEGNVMLNEDKVGLWKCPYHNTRACIELVKRIDSGHS